MKKDMFFVTIKITRVLTGEGCKFIYSCFSLVIVFKSVVFKSDFKRNE